MSKPSPNDISIGPDKWITGIDILVGRYDEAVSIDQFITRAESFWTALETNCVADCCGIGAFCFWPENIVAASSSEDREAIVAVLLSLRDFIEKNSADIFVSHRMNNLFDKRVILQLIEHIQQHLVSEAEN